MSETLELTKAMIARPSVSPVDGGCQELMIERLQAVGFEIERLRFGNVDNFWATRRAGDGPVFCFAGHTDVVPTGPLEEWHSDPFAPVLRDGLLFGRGAADMKSGLPAMVTAVESFVRARPGHAGTIAFLITSDEEGPSVDGTRRVVEVLKERHERIDWCLVGEPSSDKVFGDTVKIGDVLAVIEESDTVENRSQKAPAKTAPSAQPVSATTEIPLDLRATPSARRLAREQSVDLRLVSGASGAPVTAADVEKYAGGKAPATRPPRWWSPGTSRRHAGVPRPTAGR